MNAILIYGIDRPGLAVALAHQDLTIAVAPGAAAIAALVAEDVPVPGMASVIEARSVEAAVAALRHGADDVVLASDPDVLVAARVAAVARRHAALALTVGDLAIDLVERRVTRAGRRLPLLPREYALLVHLARAAGRVVPRAELTQAVLGLAFDPGTNVVAAHLSKLRAKLHHGFDGVMLLTEKGCGYRLVAAAGAG